MNNHPGTIDLKEITLPVVAVLLFFASSLYFPLAGFFLGIFTPLPVVFVYLKRGWLNAAAVLAITSMILLSVGGGLFAAFFFLEYGVMAMVMAKLIHQCFLREKVILFSSALPVLCGFFAVSIYFSGQDTGFTGFMEGKINLAIGETIKGYKDMGVNQEHIRTLEMYSAQMSGLFIKLLPAWFISGSLITTLLNYSTIKKLWGKWYGFEGPYFNEPPFSEWVIFDFFIWIFIASGLCLLLPLEPINLVGINLLFLSLLIYIIHGIAIALYWLEKSKKRRFFLFLGISLLLIQPLFLACVAGIGVFDIWLDFRKLRISASPLQ